MAVGYYRIRQDGVREFIALDTNDPMVIEMRQAIASWRSEGLGPDSENHDIFERIVMGEITPEEARAEIQAKLNRLR